MTDYTDRETVKAAVGRTTSLHEADYDRIITAVSRAIDAYCLRKENGFVAPSVATARLFAGSGGNLQRIDEAAAITLVAVKQSITDTTYTPWAATDWIAFSGAPDEPDFNSTPYTWLMTTPTNDSSFTSGWLSDEPSWTRGRRGLSGRSIKVAAPPMVQVTARWGYALTVPPRIAEVCIIESARWVKMGESNYSDALVNQDLGRVIMLKGLHPASKLMLDDGRFKRYAVG